MKPIIIYHFPCDDGFACATIAYKVFGKNADYFGRNHNEPFETLPNVDGRDVYILDFSFKAHQMLDILSRAKRVIWLDHHVTSINMIIENDALQKAAKYAVFNHEKCGAILTWEHFYPNEPIPVFLTLIDDSDRYQLKYPDTQPFITWLRGRPYDVDSWMRYMQLCEIGNYVNDFISVDRTLLDKFNKDVDDIIKNKTKCRLFILKHPSASRLSWEGLACNATHQYATDIGVKLANESNTFGMVWYVTTDGKVKCSLRSIGDYDVSNVAEYFGGGGHKNAASFYIDLKTFQTFIGDSNGV